VKIGRDAAANAGRSAVVGYQQARARQLRRRGVSVGLALGSFGLISVGGAQVGVHRSSAWLVALGVLAALLAWMVWPRDDPDRWLRGSAGERVTARLLAQLSPRRWVVLHDCALPRSRANVDHLVIGPSGVWVVDTKTYRAPLSIRRGWVWAGDYPVPIDPAAWEADQVADLLDVPVRAIVAVHGDGLRPRGKRCGGIPVIPADRLLRRLRRRGRRRILTRTEVTRLGGRAAEVLPEYG
jgi:Nuclease-related domain